MKKKLLKKLKKELGVDKWSKIEQEQFNDLILNISNLDMETNRYIFNEVNNLYQLLNNYFSQFISGVKDCDKRYLEMAQKNHEIMKELLKDEKDKEMRNRIADEMFRHSEWVRKEASKNSEFKRIMIAIGLGVGFIVFTGIAIYSINKAMQYITGDEEFNFIEPEDYEECID